MATDPIVTIAGLNKWFGEFHVLRDIDLSVPRGARIVICGPSGSGKSTLIRCINALEEFQEGRITVLNLLNMTSGLDEGFAYTDPAGAQFFYNTPVYAVTKRVLAAASGQSLDAMTRAWLTEPLGMKDTDWRRRPAALASAGNDTALVTTPRDIARLGLMVLSGGLAQDGTRVVSQAQLAAMFERSQANPAYGRLWWLNGADYAVRSVDRRTEGPLIAAAPVDLVGAYGLFERRLYIVPSRDLVVVRTGAAAIDKDFDQQLWLRLMKVLGDRPASASEP